MGLSEVRGGSSRIQDMMKSLQQTRAFDEGQNMGMNPTDVYRELVKRYRSPTQPLNIPMAGSEEMIQLKQAPPLKRSKGRGYCGGAAVPSMGLSEFRGGATMSKKKKRQLKDASDNVYFIPGKGKEVQDKTVEIVRKALEYILSNMEDDDGSMTKKVKDMIEECSTAGAHKKSKALVKGLYKLIGELGESSKGSGAKLSEEHIKHVEGLNSDIMDVPGESKTSSIKVIGLVKKALTYALKHLEGDDGSIASTIKDMIKSCSTGVALKKMSSDDVLDLSRELVNDFDDLISELGGTSVGSGMYSGGANIDDLLDRTNVARSGAYEGQGYMREKSMPPVAMRGGKFHRDGTALSEHLLATLGKPTHQKLLEGLMRHAMGIHGSGFFDRLKRGFEDFGRKVKNEFVNPESYLRTKPRNEFVNPESILRGKILPVASKVGKLLSPVLNLASPGVGTAVSTGLDTAQGINQEAKNLGFGRSRGCGKKRRAPAGASDGRRARADIVRKVMAERGVKMIEASKIVKAEGLY
jgi:hypothetical protein